MTDYTESYVRILLFFGGFNLPSRALPPGHDGIYFYHSDETEINIENQNKSKRYNTLPTQLPAS